MIKIESLILLVEGAHTIATKKEILAAYLKPFSKCIEMKRELAKDGIKALYGGDVDQRVTIATQIAEWIDIQNQKRALEAQHQQQLAQLQTQPQTLPKPDQTQSQPQPELQPLPPPIEQRQIEPQLQIQLQLQPQSQPQPEQIEPPSPQHQPNRPKKSKTTRAIQKQPMENLQAAVAPTEPLLIDPTKRVRKATMKLMAMNSSEEFREG